MTLESSRNAITFLIISLYLVLNWGFMLIRIPPAEGAGVPIAEIWLLILMCMILDYRWLPRFLDSSILLPFVLWWAFGIGSALLAVPQAGFWALRDATHVIESLYLWVGFVLAASTYNIDRLFVSLRRLLILASLYAFTQPFHEWIEEVSPTIQAAAGYTSPIIGWYITSPTLLILEAARRIIWSKVGGRDESLIIPAILLVYAIGFFQYRTVYLQVIAILLLLAWQRRAAFRQMSMALIMAALVLAAVVSSGIEIIGRRGEPVSLEYLVNLFAATWGSSAPGVEGAAAGVSQRLGWWANIWGQLTSDSMNFLFGLGFGHALIDFLGPDSQIVREPHNSYLSILGRMGLFGIVVFTWGHALLLRTWFRAYALCRLNNLPEGQNRLLLLMVYFVLIWVFSLGEDAFEKPFNTVPYYFFWGVVLHYEKHLRHQFTATQHVAAADSPRLAPSRAPRPGA